MKKKNFYQTQNNIIPLRFSKVVLCKTSEPINLISMVFSIKRSIEGRDFKVKEKCLMILPEKVTTLPETVKSIDYDDSYNYGKLWYDQLRLVVVCPQ